MGAHSTIYVSQTDARRLYREFVGSDVECPTQKIEDFLDRVLDERLYNASVIPDDRAAEKSDDPDPFATPVWSYSTLESYVREYVSENPHEQLDSVTNENQLLRLLLAVQVAGTELYTDDGEMLDSTAAPIIDFKRDSVVDIRRKLRERGLKRMQEIEAGIRMTGRN